MNSFTRTPLKSDGNAIWMRGSVVVLNGLVFLGFSFDGVVVVWLM